MSVLTGPALAFVDPLAGVLATGAPTVALNTLEDPPDPVLMAVVLSARLAVTAPDPVDDPSW